MEEHPSLPVQSGESQHNHIKFLNVTGKSIARSAVFITKIILDYALLDLYLTSGLARSMDSQTISYTTIKNFKQFL